MKTSLIRVSFLIMVFSLFYTCERELTNYELINYERCELENVTVNPFIVTDFECQSNIEISDVSVIRNPSETGINTSRFVGEYIDGASANDALTINFDGGLDLSTNALFKFKVKTTTTGTLRVELIGGSNGTLNFNIIIDGDEFWNEYELDLIDLQDETFTQFNLIFNNGIENSGTDIYLVDDIKFDPTIDPCEDVVTDLSIINDFDCQQNFFLGEDPTQTSVQLIENPFISGINLSENVGEYIDNGTEPFDNLIINFENPIDLAENPLFKIKVYATTTGPLLVKLEGGTTPIEITKPITMLNQWVEYTFNFNEALDAGNDKLVLFFNAGGTTGTTADTYLIDDLRFEEFIDPCLGITEDLSIISDFECQQNYTLGLDPTLISVVENIDPSGINTSDFIGEYIDDGTQPFDNLLIDYGMPIDLSENSLFKIKIYSSAPIPVLAKLEGGTTPLEITNNVTTVNEWVELSFDFSPVIGEGNDKLILFFNAGQDTGTLTDVYYIDDLRFDSNPCSQIVEDCDGVTPNLSIINDFDCQQNYNFSNPDAAPVVQNPNVSCENRSSNVGEYSDNGNDPFDFLLVNFGAPIDLSVNNQLKIKVLSTMAVPLLAKLEGGAAVEIFADITVVNEWAEYTFDFSEAQGNGNTTLVLFFNAGNIDGTPADIYYVDDIRFEAP
ncbi:hypothetical protein [Psychroserpens sp. Hel_I_66]|uniref:hypothetical protein n=1 Tax=Psychroserpens sp. Hel_I_66 TaxID=1250004 RepID=UPI000A66C509|nr:hypothetical protein [Psychroserpens sp. Hel_I_66]